MKFTKSIQGNYQVFLSRYGFAVALASILAIFSLNFLLRFAFPNYLPMTLFLSAVVVAAWAAGTPSGVFATFLGGIIEVVFFSNNFFSFFVNSNESVRVLVYLVQGIAISYIFGEFHHAQTQVLESKERLLLALEREKKARAISEKALQKLKTSQRQLNKEREIAKNANRVKTLFLAHMSHEIRTPLGAILGFTDLLKEPGLTDTERVKYLNIIDRTGNNLKDIINDILDISKVEAGHFEIDLVPFSLEALLQEIHAVLSLKCLEKNTELKFIAEGEIPNFVITDPKRLRQILVNLIGNSIKFTKKGSVTLYYHVEGENLLFRVKDTGIGISKEQRSRLFQNFSQGDDSISRRFAGTGLGLVLSRKLARMLGGDIQLRWSKLNEGSIFDVRLKFTPVAEAGTLPAKTLQPEEAKAKHSAQQEFQNKKVLVVDDSPDNQFLLERVLSKLGMVVSTASNGAEALTMTENHTYDVILMDMQMPVMDGYTAAEHLRERQCKTPVIALTAHAMKEDRLKCLNAGCTDYLTKPLQKDQLYKVLKAHC